MASAVSHSAARTNQFAWIPVFFGLAVICMESTNTMGAGHTAVWLQEFLHWTGHQDGLVGMLNHVLRKGGHFTGYGLLGICFARGWFSLLRRRITGSWSSLRLRAGAFGIASTLVVASADEIHQIFLPTRGASVWDVLLDTSGAVVLNLIFFGYLALRRNALLQPGPFTTLGLSFAGLPQRVSNSREMRQLVQRSTRRAVRFHRSLGNVRRMGETASR
jgi:VanZ family protein